MLQHWFVIANQTGVKILKELSPGNRLIEVKTLENPIGRERNRALVRRQAGSGMKSMGRIGNVHFSEVKHDPHDEAAHQFAKKIVQTLDKDRVLKHFNSLTIVAEPHFLGKIRSAMKPGLKKLVVKWLNKDLQKTPTKDLIHLLTSKKDSLPTPYQVGQL